ncbi:MAG TPA: hypothetical protein VF804_11525 [Holophagaceae bacterium]
MNLSMLLLPAIVLPSTLVAQAPAPTLGEQVRATRPAVEKLMADLKFQEALQQAQTLLPATRPAFDKTNNQTMLTCAIRAIDLGQAYRLAVEAADAAGQWEKALDYAKEAKAIAGESYDAVKDPFQKMVAYYDAAGSRAQQVIWDNADRIKYLKSKQNPDPGEKQEMELAAGVEKEIQDDAKWSKFFQTYIKVAKEETTAYDPLISVMEKKIQGEADQIAEYKAGKGDKLKWVEAVVSSPAYLEAQGDKAGKMRFLSRLAVIDPDSKKVQHQIDLLTGKAVEPAPKHVIRKKK